MIALFSFEGDKNTNYLIEWLSYYNCQFIRADLEKEDFRNIELNLDDSKVRVKLKLHSGTSLDLSECNFFYVRGKGFSEPDFKNITELPDKVYYKYIKQEFSSLTTFFYTYINEKAIGRFYNDSHIKLLQLYYARQVGLNICNSFITRKKKELVSHYDNEQVITKAIEDNIAIRQENKLIVQRVQRVNYHQLEDTFFPSFFQDEIDKEYEIRTYCLDGSCYSIRFNSNSTNIDMRDNYDISEYEPYKLPTEIEEKVRLLMHKLNLISGSLDLIKSKNGKYYFLEINLNGQYDWVSHYGGYNLHKKIAHFLYLKSNS